MRARLLPSPVRTLLRARKAGAARLASKTPELDDEQQQGSAPDAALAPTRSSNWFCAPRARGDGDDLPPWQP
jgi:hypothetical protein